MDLPIPISVKIFLIIGILAFYLYPLLFTIVNIVREISKTVLSGISNFSRK